MIAGGCWTGTLGQRALVAMSIASAYGLCVECGATGAEPLRPRGITCGQYVHTVHLIDGAEY